MPFNFVFDVESIGLHGEGFAVGFVVVDRTGLEYDHGLFACDPWKAQGTPKDMAWVRANVPDLEFTHESPRDVREAFWQKLREWSLRGAHILAEVNWPVEARFLMQCVDDDRDERYRQGPYPLHDIATLLWADGRDPLEKMERLENERPEHNPLADARQSARLLAESLRWAGVA